MIRLTEDVILEVQKRGCPPVEFFVFALRLQMWPIFQRGMADNIDALKKIAEGASTGYFSRAATTTDAGVSSVSRLRSDPLFGRPQIYFLDMPAVHRTVQLAHNTYGTSGGNHDFLEVCLFFLSSAALTQKS